MNQGIDILHEALQSQLPTGLEARVRASLLAFRARQERTRHAVRVFCASLSLVSFGGIFFSIKAFLSAASASGFTAYASLMLSDSSTVSAHLASFLEGLAEVMPSTETIIVLALVSVFLVSLRNAVGFGAQVPRTHIHAAY